MKHGWILILLPMSSTRAVILAGMMAHHFGRVMAEILLVKSQRPIRRLERPPLLLRSMDPAVEAPTGR